MKEAGMNPALAYGLTGGGGQSASGGGSGAGATAGSGSGNVNPTTQAVMMGLQAKGIQSQIRVNQATIQYLSSISLGGVKSKVRLEKAGSAPALLFEFMLKI